LPAGDYVAHVVGGSLRSSRRQTPGYRLTFEVVEGEHTGRLFWHDLWLTAAAVPMTKRDLAKLGVPVDDFQKMIAHLEGPLPEGIRCHVHLAVRTDNDGNRYNRVVRFTVVRVDGPQRDAYAPGTGEAEVATRERDEEE
jgi:hypothetical protein